MQKNNNVELSDTSREKMGEQNSNTEYNSVFTFYPCSLLLQWMHTLILRNLIFSNSS